MQTFVPVATIGDIALVLDNKRLFKQAVEAKQIYLALTTPGYGWQSHPAVKMWKGYENALLTYAHAMVAEHLRRGYSSSILMPWVLAIMVERSVSPSDPLPWWWGDNRIHSSHRAALYRKNPDHYPQWANETATEYWWPVKEKV
jgi:hypothetical protein